MTDAEKYQWLREIGRFKTDSRNPNQANHSGCTHEFFSVQTQWVYGTGFDDVIERAARKQKDGS